MGLKPTARPSEPLRGRLREVDPDRGAIVRELAVRIDPALTPGPEAHQELTAAEWDGELVVQPAHTEVLWVDPARLEVVRRTSHPLFHGLHSAAPGRDGGLVVTCAGTESVLELGASGELVRHRWLRDGGAKASGAGFADAYPGITDFRTVDHDALKPHSHHPNHAGWVGEELWTTCFETREAVALGSPAGRRIALPEAVPHDGRLRAGWLWFTQVTGRVVAVDPVTLERRLELDLAALTGTRRQLGWCRGVEVVGSRLFVGMTMLRATRHREVLRQLLRGEAGEKLPTRVVEVDLDRPRIVREIEVGNAAGGTIYSILAR
jgi:hypothetical protein